MKLNQTRGQFAELAKTAENQRIAQIVSNWISYAAYVHYPPSQTAYMRFGLAGILVILAGLRPARMTGVSQNVEPKMFQDQCALKEMLSASPNALKQYLGQR
jgi:hypothetical protein